MRELVDIINAYYLFIHFYFNFKDDNRYHTQQKKKQLWLVGFTFGIITGILFTDHFFDSTIISAFIGITTGLIVGWLTIFDGILSGLIGGTMGAMIGTMMDSEHHEQLIKLTFLLYIGTMLLLYRIMQREIIKKQSFLSNPFVLTILFFVTILTYNQLGPFFPNSQSAQVDRSVKI
ncbi:hypothetical protein M3649_20040 [Ureibacillus chungkukjangi]|uniref:hypothetical protein n=1 Tax=Ureibacillus chungkukjangi TaxID=1202712 RepID=UPI00203CD752|nr:hypothetical protein [Ureibacillus chungkukjangi]MCM3390387.1 hypothetical protein [Ureibacillus chungkukjangi]